MTDEDDLESGCEVRNASEEKNEKRYVIQKNSCLTLMARGSIIYINRGV